MRKMFLLFSHTFAQPQKNDAISSLDVSEFIELPDTLQTLWSNISAELKTLGKYLKPLK